MKEADNILRILKQTRQAIGESDSYKLKKLSDQTIHSAAIYQDPDNIIIAVLVYSIAKIIEREHYKEMPGYKKFYLILTKNLDLAIKNLEQGQSEKYRDAIGRIRNAINLISGNLSEYIKDVFRKSRINKAFKIYEHGLSSEQTAKLLGVSMWDLATYIGQSSISEAKIGDTMPVRTRIKIAEDIFS